MQLAICISVSAAFAAYVGSTGHRGAKRHTSLRNYPFPGKAVTLECEGCMPYVRLDQSAVRQASGSAGSAGLPGTAELRR